MQLNFLGAAGTVTGSKYLITIDDKNILVDCGLFQGYKELRLRNWDRLPVRPHDIDMVILTHAHLDHSGYLPLLVKHGFKGPIYATSGTRDLCSILLPDSGRIQEEDAFFANKHGFSKHHPALPLYTEDDAEKAMRHFRSVEFNKKHELFGDSNFVYFPAAHILGAAIVRITHKNTSIVFSGDLGRSHDPIMREPATIESADYLVLESTYGDSIHGKESPAAQLAKIINETSVRGGKLIIPAFAVGRAQSILYYIAQLKEQGLIPNIPVFLDSPMAVDATSFYQHYIKEHRIGPEHYHRVFGTVTYVNTVVASKKLDAYRGSAIIISASGMATGGRVLHHLKQFAPDARNTILFTGYQAGGTRGARMMQGESQIKIHGEMVTIRAEIKMLANASAHADSDEILQWLSHIKKAPKKVFITHGEPPAAAALKAKIEAQLGWRCVVPAYQQRVELI